MTAVIATDDAQTGWLKIHITGDTTAVAHAYGSILNPEGVLLHIYEAFLYRSAASAAAATLDLGINATIDTDDTDLCSALAINATGMVKIVGTDLASEGAATTPRGQLWPAGSYLVCYEAAAQASTLFVGDLYVHYIRLA
jgi:hypothetical protein